MNYFPQRKLSFKLFLWWMLPLAIAQQNHSITFDVEFKKKKKERKSFLSLFIFFTFAVMADCQVRGIQYTRVRGLVLVRSEPNPPTLYIQTGVWNWKVAVYIQSRQMYCVYRENVYNRRHFNVHTEKYTLGIVVAWKSRPGRGRLKDSKLFEL